MRECEGSCFPSRPYPRNPRLSPPSPRPCPRPSPSHSPPPPGAPAQSIGRHINTLTKLGLCLAHVAHVGDTRLGTVAVDADPVLLGTNGAASQHALDEGLAGAWWVRAGAWWVRAPGASCGAGLFVVVAQRTVAQPIAEPREVSEDTVLWGASRRPGLFCSAWGPARYLASGVFFACVVIDGLDLRRARKCG